MIDEVQLAAAGDDYLRKDGWDVLHEVALEWALRSSTPVGNGRADHVALKGNLLGVMECKLTLSFELFDQAERWLDFAHIVWILVPYAKPSAGRYQAFKICRRYYGFGVLEAGDEGVVVQVEPREREIVDPALLHSLRPEHRDHGVSGSREGGYATAFSTTTEALVRFVDANPRCKIEEAVPRIKHHYRNDAQAVNELTKAIRKGLIPALKTGWKQRLEIVPRKTEEEPNGCSEEAS